MFLGVALLFMAGLTPAVQASEPGEWSFEVFGGWLWLGDLEDVSKLPGNIPDDIEALGVELNDDYTLGLRIGRRHSEKFGYRLSLSFIDIDDSFEGFEDIPESRLSLESYFLDIGFYWYVTGKNFYLFAGPGLVFGDAQITGPGGTNWVDETETNFGGFVGLGTTFEFGGATYIRLEGLGRIYDTDIYSGEMDPELTVALGWNFGG
jgi:hypothetical protein